MPAPKSYEELGPEQQDALRALAGALHDPGHHPEHHRRVVARTEDQWPTLMQAVRRVLDSFAPDGGPDLYGVEQTQFVASTTLRNKMSDGLIEDECIEVELYSDGSMRWVGAYIDGMSYIVEQD